MKQLDVHLDADHNGEDIPQQEQFLLWVNTTINHISNSLPESIQEVCIRIIDSKQSAHLNQTFRNKQGPTNILSFHYEPVPGMPTESLGDLAICHEIVAAEAEQQHKQLQAHWAHLTIHGILHLLDYNHIKDEDAEQMEQLEIEILKTLNYPNPYEN